MLFSRALIVGLFLGGAALAHAGGQVYRYVETDGTVVYTNVLSPGVKGARRVGALFTAAQAPESPARVSPGSAAALAQYDTFIREAALKYRVPVDLVRAVMHAESAFIPHAVSAVGASGLMQLMPQTARDMYVKDIFDVRENIEGGVRYLRVLANEFDGDMVKIIAAYNAGPEAVRRAGGKVPPFAETRGYVKKVLALYGQYKARGQSPGNEAASR